MDLGYFQYNILKMTKYKAGTGAPSTLPHQMWRRLSHSSAVTFQTTAHQAQQAQQSPASHGQRRSRKHNVTCGVTRFDGGHSLTNNNGSCLKQALREPEASHWYLNIVFTNDDLNLFVLLRAHQHFATKYLSSSQELTFHAMETKTSLHTDPYVLAYRYWDYIIEHPRRNRENLNSYYEKLLANQPAPDPKDMDERSRAIRYAKEHHECFYEVRDIKRIIEWLDTADTSPKTRYVLHRW
jgi:hypothetical protein